MKNDLDPVSKRQLVAQPVAAENTVRLGVYLQKLKCGGKMNCIRASNWLYRKYLSCPFSDRFIDFQISPPGFNN